jgi:hypothetical protein
MIVARIPLAAIYEAGNGDVARCRILASSAESVGEEASIEERPR